MHMMTAPLPVHFQMLCESSKLYDPGQQYASHVRQLQRGDEPDVRYDFEPHVPAGAWYVLVGPLGGYHSNPCMLCQDPSGIPQRPPTLQPITAFPLSPNQVSSGTCPEEQFQRRRCSWGRGHEQCSR